MDRRRLALVIAVVCLVAGVGALGFLVGGRHALDNLTVIAATPDELAAAMQNDRFYADYNERTLVVQGVVASLTGDATGAVLQFQTQGAFTTRCRFDQYPATVHQGDTIRVVAEGATAERLPSAVLLTGCSVLGG
jgi:hypothetical protein